MSKNARYQTILLDEHVSPDVREPFVGMGFKCTEIARINKYAGRDEMDYLNEMYSRNQIFVTSDLIFLNAVMESGSKHAGLVYMPNKLLRSEQVLWGWAAAGLIAGISYKSKYGMRGKILYPAHDGIHIVDRHIDRLDISWDYFADRV